MGRTKGRNVKAAAKTLLRNYPDAFSTDFSKNKGKLKELGLYQGNLQQSKLAAQLVNDVKALQPAKED
jgi:ribosomal protein S17E